MIDLIYKLSKGQRRSLKIVLEVLSIDRKYLLILEKLGLFGKQLYFLYKDSCQGDMDKFIRLLENFNNNKITKHYIHKHIRKTRGLNIEIEV